MKKLLFLLVTITLSTTVFAQKNINNYKYIIVPNQFDFVKSPDKYQTSSLTKFLFNKHHFKAFLSDEALPDEVLKNRCLSLTANVKDNSGMFSTKSIIELIDCKNNVVYTTKAGRSKQKDYKKAYHESIRKAFESISALGYKYTPSSNITPSETPKIIKQIPVVKQQLSKKVIPHTKPVPVRLNNSQNVLYAQPQPNGFQLVNTQPKVVFKLLKTNIEDVFIIQNKNGILYKNNQTWTAEYYNNGNKIIKNYTIKF